jgi:hypothetical protein
MLLKDAWSSGVSWSKTFTTGMVPELTYPSLNNESFLMLQLSYILTDGKNPEKLKRYVIRYD